MNVGKTKLMRLSKQPSLVDIMANRKQLEIQDCQGKSSIQQDTFHQKTEITLGGSKSATLGA
jgi:hypothetical protein